MFTQPQIDYLKKRMSERPPTTMLEAAQAAKILIAIANGTNLDADDQTFLKCSFCNSWPTVDEKTHEGMVAEMDVQAKAAQAAAGAAAAVKV